MIYCRHRKCRTKLKKPVSNKREAFCCPRLSYQFLPKALPGLRGAHYSVETRRRRFAENRGAATIGGLKLGSAATAPPPLLAWLQKPLILLGQNRPLKPNRAWRQVAGPKLTTSQLQCALVGAEEAVAEAHQKNRPYWRKHNAKALIQPHHPPVNILGGYRFPDAPEVILQEGKRTWPLPDVLFLSQTLTWISPIF